MNRFRTVALALRPYISDTYNLLDAADAVVALDDTIPVSRPEIKSPDGKATWDWDYSRWRFDHDDLVNVALNNSVVMQYVADGKKINAIKELRAVSRAGLKESKEAVEDQRVVSAANDPWGPYKQPF